MNRVHELKQRLDEMNRQREACPTLGFNPQCQMRFKQIRMFIALAQEAMGSDAVGYDIACSAATKLIDDYLAKLRGDKPSDTAQAIIEEFDQAAQSWGYYSDQGSHGQAEESQAEWIGAKDKLERYIVKLEREVQQCH